LDFFCSLAFFADLIMPEGEDEEAPPVETVVEDAPPPATVAEPAETVRVQASAPHNPSIIAERR